MFRSICFILAASTVGWLFATPNSVAGLGYYNWPTVHGKQLYFTSEGDIWRASSDGSEPTRLTTHIEEESSPVVSPDGNSIAFNAHYDGRREVYVMPVAGGVPKQLTFEGGGARVCCWTADGKVLYQSGQVVGPRKTCVLTKVDPIDLSAETVPFIGATDGAYADDLQTLYITRFGLSLSGDNARLYRGGAMAQLWRLPADAEEAERLAEDFDAPIRHPMCWKGRVYFVSDKSGEDNIWSFDANGSEPQQHTDFRGWELRNAKLSDGVVYYQRGGDLYQYNIAANKETKILIQIASDRDDARLRWIDEPLDYFESARISGDGESVAVTARGRVAIAFPSRRRRVELNIPADARARSAIVGPNGEWVYMVLDQDRYGEIWRHRANGLGEAEQLTENSDTHIWRIYPSPDGTCLLYTDKRKRLWSLDLKTRIKGLLETSESADDDPIGEIAWSHGGRYVAYTNEDRRSIRRVILRDLKNGRREEVTSGKYESFAPAISADSRWLYFVSNRNFSPSPSSPWGDRNLGPALENRGKLYALQLDPDALFPFAPVNELSVDAKKSDGEHAESEDGEASTESAEEEAEVIFDGVADRLWSVPVDPGSYSELSASSDFLYVIQREDGKRLLKSIAIDSQDPNVEVFASKISSFQLSNDRKTLFYRSGRGDGMTLALVSASAKAPKELSDEHRVRIGSWRIGVVPQEEWRQMLLDAWRLHREFAFDTNLRGVDWDGVRDKYLPLVDRIGHRVELNDLLSQMVDELGILHSQIRSGDEPRDTESGTAASLGAEYEVVDDGLRISRIYEGDPDLLETLGPLQKSGVDVRVGDTIAAVNGHPIANRAELARRLQGRASHQVLLGLLRDGEEREVVVKPMSLSSAIELPYRHWVQRNRERVRQESEAKIGYLHLRAMGSADMASFARDFFEHYDKEGLIIDVRGNRGGNIDSWILSTLRRKAWAFWEDPSGGPAYTNMQQAFRGHLAVLINESTYSDGETFSAGVKALDLAPLIGTRTAGAGIWLTGRNWLVDRGVARIAEFPQFSLDGRWLVEGWGVSPNIAVTNPPVATFRGEDAQLEYALDYLGRRIESYPIPKLRGQPLPRLGTPGQDVIELD